MVGSATLVGTPIGILAGIYLAEFGRSGWLAHVDALHQRHPALSAPSIVIGLFVYTVVRRARASISPGWAGVDGAGAHRRAGGRAHHREHAAAGAQQPARGGRRARRAEVEGDR